MARAEDVIMSGTGIRASMSRRERLMTTEAHLVSEPLYPPFGPVLSVAAIVTISLPREASMGYFRLGCRGWPTSVQPVVLML